MFSPASVGVLNLCGVGLDGFGRLAAGADDVLVEEEDEADVGHHVRHVGAEALVEPPRALLPAHTGRPHTANNQKVLGKFF